MSSNHSRIVLTGVYELDACTISECTDAVFCYSVLMMRVGSTKSLGLFLSLTVLYPLVRLENTVVAVVMLYVSCNPAKISFAHPTLLSFHPSLHPLASSTAKLVIV